ncbi:MAG: tRNA (guanosine(37)-N1)-methyltransferase TrmD [Actinobacteria bacterium]|nr:tRNA (guanosine(37)-N1)-methyltransferase TrmD [Actinomycetota bacterium]
MLEIHIATIFPEFFNSSLRVGNIKRSLEKNLVHIEIHNLRDFTSDPHKKVDDKPYGGGSGMVMTPEPFFKLCFHITGTETPEDARNLAEIILLTPRGKLFDQATAEELSKTKKKLIFLCGRYEGIDERVAEYLSTRQISIGDYVLSGGEPAALVIIDAIVRLIPGVVGDYESVEKESFSENLLEYPQYTRPENFMGYKVPKILLSGNHRLIDAYRLERRIIDTYNRRPDLFEKFIQKKENLDIARRFLRNFLLDSEKNDQTR